MHQPPTYTTWKVTCPSAAEALALQHWLSSRIDLDRVITDTVHTALNGVEQVKSENHRLGDYFADIRIVPDMLTNGASFRLVFQRRPDAGRYWKDLMVGVLQEIESTPRNSVVELDSKAELEPTTFTSH